MAPYKARPRKHKGMAKDLPMTALRLRERMEEVGVSQTSLADAVGTSQATISQILTGTTRNSRLLPKIAQCLAVNLNWLLGVTDDKIDMFDKEGEPLSEDTLAAMQAGAVTNRLINPEQLRTGNQLPGPLVDEDVVEIDRIDLAYGMGGSFLDNATVEVEKVKFSASWLREFTKTPPHLLVTTQGLGDSMMPTIHDRDVVIIDRSQKHPDMGDKIWAITYAGMGMIKRLRFQPDGTVKISSDNQLIRDELATDGDLFIVGRVIAIMRSV